MWPGHHYTPNNNAGFQKSLSSLDAKSIVREISLNSTSNVETHEDFWKSLCLRVLQLFNGEELTGTIEEANHLLRECLKERTAQSFVGDLNKLFSTSMLTLNTKLQSVSEGKTLYRLVEVWTFFYGTLLPYLEGIFLPLQTGDSYSECSGSINIRRMALISFRDNIICTHLKRLEGCLHKIFHEQDIAPPNYDLLPRIFQMISILNCLRTEDEHQGEIQKVVNILIENWVKKKKHFVAPRKKSNANSLDEQ